LRRGASIGPRSALELPIFYHAKGSISVAIA
jgi:hypothetical protein